MKLTSTILVATFVALLIGGAAQAALLNLELLLPDVESGFIDVQYDADSDLFTASGFALTLDFDGEPPPDEDILDGLFSLSLFVDENGVPAGGTIEITGSVLDLGPDLLTGNITEFGFMDSPGGEIFEFVFDVTGGDLAPQFGPLGGVILDAVDSGFGGTFDTSFANSGFSGVADTAPIPEPATGLSLLMGAAVWQARRRSRKSCR